MWYIVKWSRACYWRMKAPLSDSTHLHWDYRVVSGGGAAVKEGAVLWHQSILEGSVNYCCLRVLCPRWVSFFIMFLLIFKLGSMSMNTFLTLIFFLWILIIILLFLKKYLMTDFFWGGAEKSSICVDFLFHLLQDFSSQALHKRF